jgi:hypothetical protein
MTTSASWAAEAINRSRDVDGREVGAAGRTIRTTTVSDPAYAAEHRCDF